MMKNKYTRKVILSLGLGLLGSVAAHAQQKIGKNPGSLNPGAVLELEADNKGFLLPRIGIPNLGAWGLPGTATEGMMVYNNGTTGTTAGYYVWSGGAWTRISTGTSANDLTFSNGLTRTGNAITLGGALAAPTTLTLGTQSLTFNASGTAQVIIQGPAGNTAGLRLSNLTGAGTAGTAGQKVLSVNASGDIVLATDFGTANAGTVTNVTGTAPITVTNGTTAPVIGINQAALDLNSIGGTLPISKITPSGTTGQVLTSNGTSAPTWTTLPASSNIYNADGTLSFHRVMTQNGNDMNFVGFGKLRKLSGDNAVRALIDVGRAATEFEIGVAAAAAQGFPNSTIGDVWLKSNLSTGNLLVGTQAATSLRLMTNNEERMTILSDGRVGIGTNNPQRNLHVAGGGIRVDRLASAGPALLHLNQLDASNNLVGGFGLLADTLRLNIGFSANAGAFATTAGTLTYTREGRLGLGTTLPTQTLDVNGAARVRDLAGTGTRMVVADASGVLSTQAVPSSSNIYTADGTLGGARTVTQSTNTLTFNGTGALRKFSGTGPALFAMGRTAEEMLMGVANANADGFGMSTIGDGWLRTTLSTGNLLVGTAAATNLRLITNGVERVTITPEGNVGMGTNAPSQRLHVVGGALISSLAGTGSRMVVADASGVLSTQAVPVSNPGTVTNVTGTAPITVTNGTTTPVIGINQAALDLNSIGGTLPISKITPSGTAGQVLTSNGTSAPTWTTLPASSNIYNADGTLSSHRVMTQNGNDMNFVGLGKLRKMSGDNAVRALIDVGRAATEFEIGVAAAAAQGFPNGTIGDVWLKSNLSTGNLLVGTQAATSLRLMTNNSERMTITSAGNVGIGTSAPTRPLHIEENGTSFEQFLIRNSGTTTTVSDNAGITVESVNRNAGLNVISGATSESRVSLARQGGAISAILLGDVNGFNIRTGSASNTNIALSIDNSQNVGIGTTTPASRLDVNGSFGTAIRRITAATTLGNLDHTIIANAFAAGFAITLPAPNTCSGRIYVIRKVDESSNALTFTFTGITGTNAIRVSDSSATAGVYMNSLNYTRTIRIQSDGTDWYMID